MNPLNIVIGIVIIVLVIIILRYLLYDPYTLQDIQDGKTRSTIEPDDLATDESDVPSSNFAYSVWFYVNDWNYKYGKPKIIFGRMGGKSAPGKGFIPGIDGVDPCPVVVLGAVENNIAVSLGCYPGLDEQPSTPGGNSVVHTCSISNIPIQKWVNLVVSVYGRTMDLYIDGKLVRTCLLPGVANVNNRSKIIVTPKGGFDGWTSKLQYYPNSLNPQEVWNIYTRGYSSWASIFKSYEIQISLLQNGTEQSSVTF